VGYITKPFAVDDLLAGVRRVLETVEDHDRPHGSPPAPPTT
jgi:DNA-binding response OmpR family regulator